MTLDELNQNVHPSSSSSPEPPANRLKTRSSSSASPPQRARSTTTGTYTSSLYVDAFHTALDTVLHQESYLFSADEAAVFAKFRSLPYEAQHLYVRLFLRRTDAWFRIEKLQYPDDISDIHAACRVLQSPGVELADTEEVIMLEEAAGLLSLDELRAVAKDAKAPGGGNKAQLIRGLKAASRAQAGLKAGVEGQLKLSFDTKGNYVNREAQVVKKMLERTGPCIRLSPAVTTLFNRVHLVFYRSTEWTETSLTTVILSRTQKRNFPYYIVSRTANIFPTRQSLLAFEASLQLQSQVDELLATPSDDAALQKILDIFNDTYPLWQTLVAAEATHTSTAGPEHALERVYLRRFDAAWVYTRIVHKGVYTLGRFKQYRREHSVLSALLKQTFFQSARRGGWYQRKALIEENYMAALDTTTSSLPADALTKNWRKAALATCEAGLQDPQTHIIFHYDLQKRILKLEHKLRIAKRDQHDFGHARLQKPTERTIFGERLNAPDLGRKTLWRNPSDDGSGKCGVEEMCLAVYKREGWKGYHSEGGIVRTLFGYLFYDILFLYLPNVFETEFQTCPLDLFTDAFYPARASEINHRLVDIANGGAKRIVKGVWEAHHERKTCVVGLDWKYPVEELEEIVDCFPADALATLCKVLCQEYRQRGSGVPDLFLWMVSEEGGGECMFSEVKSENDRLSDTQRLWIHVLSSAGVRVELCYAKAKRKEEEVEGKKDKEY